jgi:16S rRNA (guanine527-N7)-methyltransferase
LGTLYIREKEREQLYSWTNALGIQLSAYEENLLSVYLDELWEWNRKMNLTGISCRKRIIKELLLDSLISSYSLPDTGRLLDVGSGAGFPGIPIKLCKPGLEIHLMEPNSKKVNFLRQVIRLMHLTDIKVTRGRIDMDAGTLYPDGYHIITARAVGPLPTIIPWLAPHLKPKGILINFQGEQFKTVLEKSEKEMEKTGLCFHKSISYKLPESELSRHILVFIKQSD